MNYQELANFIRNNYTPLAFTCSCEGEDESCALAMENPATYAQFSVVNRIANAIAGMESL